MGFSALNPSYVTRGHCGPPAPGRPAEYRVLVGQPSDGPIAGVPVLSGIGAWPLRDVVR